MSQEDLGADPPTPSPVRGEQSEAPLKDRATTAAQQAQQGAGEVAQTAVERTKDVAAESQRQARNLLSEARGQAARQASDQQRQLATNLRSFAEELDRMTQRSEQSGLATEVVSHARDRAWGAADWLDGRQPGDLLEEIRRVGRNHPGAFLASAAIAGGLVGRLTRGTISAHSGDGPEQRGIPGADRLGAPPEVPGTGAEPIGYGAPAVGERVRGETPYAGEYAAQTESYPAYPPPAPQ